MANDYSMLYSRRRWIIQGADGRWASEYDRQNDVVLAWTDNQEDAATVDRIIDEAIREKHPEYTTERVI